MALNILIADDNPTNRSIFSRIVERMGHASLHAENGQEAVDMFQRHHPDLILMDVMMPVEDGLSATARIKAMGGIHWTPVVMVTALNEPDDVVRGLEAGADDYLTKPINVKVVHAKIRSLQHALEMQRQVEEKTRELERYYLAAEDEKRLTTHLMQRLVETEKLGDPALEYWLSPTESCSGDLIAAARTPGGVLHVMLADGTGHGLSAALNVIPLPQIFYAMTSKGFSIGSIAAEMNAKIKGLLPTDHFIAATLASIDAEENLVEVWNGGNPPAWLINPAGEVVHALHSRHLPLGILDPALFDTATETYQMPDAAQLLVFSDGLPDAGNEHGQPFGTGGMLDMLRATPPADRMTGLQQNLRNHLGKANAHDDISVVLVSADLLRLERLPESPATYPMPSASQSGSGWRISMRLGGPELQHLDPIPFTTDLLKRMQVARPHLSNLFLIISELFNNALDHGLLGLDSKTKHDMDGFTHYLQQRMEKLAGLGSGSIIEFELEIKPRAAGDMLYIRIKDSGPGFDYRATLAAQEQTLPMAHGRGIHLIRQLAASIEYLEPGNEVLVAYAL